MPGIEKKECHFYEKINHLVFHFFVILFIWINTKTKDFFLFFFKQN
jgi:hypothetical protein